MDDVAVLLHDWKRFTRLAWKEEIDGIEKELFLCWCSSSKAWGGVVNNPVLLSLYWEAQVRHPPIMIGNGKHVFYLFKKCSNIKETVKITVLLEFINCYEFF